MQWIFKGIDIIIEDFFVGEKQNCQSDKTDKMIKKGQYEKSYSTKIIFCTYRMVSLFDFCFYFWKL